MINKFEILDFKPVSGPSSCDAAELQLDDQHYEGKSWRLLCDSFQVSYQHFVHLLNDV